MDLIAGPWVGEFGWELMSWQAFIRALVYKHKFKYVTVFGPRGHDELYDDFADVYVPVELPGIRDCWRVEGADFRDKTKLNQAIHRLVKHDTKVITPSCFVPVSEQHFVAFGNPENVAPKDRFDVLVHVRKQINKRRHHAWPSEHAETVCNKLLERGLSLAAIGTEAWCPKGVENRLCIPLKELMNLISAARVIIGPSSGPMHLASLCRTPHLVWTDRQWYSAIKASNKTRYERTWNPLNTPCIVLEEGWNPNPDLIVLKTQEALALRKPITLP